MVDLPPAPSGQKKKKEIIEVVRNHIFLSSLGRSANAPNDGVFLQNWMFQHV